MHDPGQIFTASFTSSALSTAGGHDLISLLSTAQSQVEILSLELQQLTTAPAALGIELWRGSTGVPAGAAITPANRNGWAAALAAKSGLTANSSTQLSTASATRLHASGFELDSGAFRYEPELPPVISSTGQRFHARITAPSAGIAINGTLTFAERGRVPS